MKAKFNLLTSALCVAMLLFGNLWAYAAEITAKGTVTDQSQEPLIGVSVTVKGNPGIGTTTDYDGNFTIKVSEGATLIVSYIGYVTKEVIAAPNMNIVLNEDNLNLEEVVVIG